MLLFLTHSVANTRIAVFPHINHKTVHTKSIFTLKKALFAFGLAVKRSKVTRIFDHDIIQF